MLNFASNELTEWHGTYNSFEQITVPAKMKTAVVKILAEKVRAPEVAADIERPRLFAHLEKSLAQFSATLLTGRAGTGKTALAAEFAKHKNYAVAWYKIDVTDRDWTVFSSYFAESLREYQSASQRLKPKTRADLSVTDWLDGQFAAIETTEPLLIVLDELHSVFDAEWFAEFFAALLALPTPNVRLLLLARSAPSFPIWRMRSKHVLDIMDEKLLTFTPDETIELFENYRLSEKSARVAHRRAYGRIAKLKEIAGKK